MRVQGRLEVLQLLQWIRHVRVFVHRQTDLLPSFGDQRKAFWLCCHSFRWQAECSVRGERATKLESVTVTRPTGTSVSIRKIWEAGVGCGVRFRGINRLREFLRKTVVSDLIWISFIPRKINAYPHDCYQEQNQNMRCSRLPQP